MPVPEKAKKRLSRWLLFQGIFFTSVSSLGLEITLTRFFASSRGYHFAYLVISMALLGYGAAGAFLRVFPGLREQKLQKTLVISTLLFSVSIMGSYLAVNILPFDFSAIWDKTQIVYLLIDFVVMAVPFFFSGLIISSCMYVFQEEIGKIYFSDLSGAGVGCFLPLLFFSLAWGERIILVFVVCALLAMLCFSLISSGVWRYISSVLILAAILLAIADPAFLQIRISPSRDIMTALRYEESRILDTRWNAVSRIDIIDSPAVRFAPGLSIRYLEPLPDQTGIAVDGGSLQAATSLEEGKMGFLEHLPSSLVYSLAQKDKVYVYDYGGGLDIVAALYFGAGRIDASEKNPGLAEYFQDFYLEGEGEYQEDFDFSRLNMIAGDGRSHLLSSEQNYDIMVIPLADTLGAAAGVFASGEDYRFTVQAFTEYYNRLRPEGFISVTRYLKPIPTEEAKLLNTIIDSIGQDIAPENILAIRSWGTITVLVKKGSIQIADINVAREFCLENGFDLVYYPQMPREEANVYNRFAEPIYYDLYQTLLDETKRDVFINSYIFNIKAATDDSPFFYNYFSPGRIKPLLQSVSGKWLFLIQGGYHIPLVIIMAFILSMVLILLPVMVKQKKEFKDAEQKRKWAAILYFVFIAAGYMFIEISFIHKTVLVMGNPVYSLTIILFSLLISSGLGSLYVGTRVKNLRKAVITAASLIILLLAANEMIMPHLENFLLQISFTWRIIIMAGYILPLGFFMGMPFPLGMKILGRDNREMVPWAWCANSCASVVSAPLSLFLALLWGFSLVIRAAGLAYIMAAAMLLIFQFKASPVMGTKATSAM